jgi:hypothetical protein
MSYDTPELTDQEVLPHAQSTLQAPLPLQAEGYVCTPDELRKVWLGVAVNRGTLESGCAALGGTPDPQPIRGSLTAQLRAEEVPELAQRLNAAVAAELPPRLWRHAPTGAIDPPDRPYDGTAPPAEGWWVRGQAKAGAARFYRVATAYLRLKGLRGTLALHFVRPAAGPVSSLERWLTRVRALGLRVAGLVLDKGFDGSAAREYLTRQHQPARIACTIRGQQGGSRALGQGRTSYRTTHPCKGARGQGFTAAVAVCRGVTTARRTQRLKRRAQGRLFSLLHLDRSPRYARQVDRGRCGLEASSRCTGQVRGWTTAKNPAYGFVLWALAFVLLNVWVPLRWIFTQVPRRGRRRLDTTGFQLLRLAKFLHRALEQLYGCTQIVTAPAVPQC